MKRTLLLFAGLLIGLTTASATEFNTKKEGYDLDKTNRYHFAQPIMFIEQGVEYMIFPDGSFDFDILYKDAFNNNTNSRRHSINSTYSIKNKTVQYSSPRVVNIQVIKDRYGKITRIGNTMIRYDRMGDVTQIGSVNIDYNRGNKLLTNVGGLKVSYNNWGEIVRVSGYVNRLNINSNRTLAKTNEVYYGNDFDNDYFYYKKNGEIKKLKKNKHA